MSVHRDPAASRPLAVIPLANQAAAGVQQNAVHAACGPLALSRSRLAWRRWRAGRRVLILRLVPTGWSVATLSLDRLATHPHRSDRSSDIWTLWRAGIFLVPFVCPVCDLARPSRCFGIGIDVSRTLEWDEELNVASFKVSEVTTTVSVRADIKKGWKIFLPLDTCWNNYLSILRRLTRG